MNDRFSSLSRLFFLMSVALLPWCANGQSLPDSLPPIDSLTDWQVNELSRQFATQARQFEQVLSVKSQSAINNRTVAEETWRMAKADSSMAKTTIDSLAGLLKTAKNAEKTALRQESQAAKTREMADKTADSDNITQRKNLRKLWKDLKQVNEWVNPAVIETPKAAVVAEAPKEKKREKKKKETPENTPVAPVEAIQPDTMTTPAPVVEIPEKTKSPAPVVSRTKKYDPAQDVMLNPPTLPCRMAVKTRDEFSGEIYRRTEAVELFRHAPPALKNFLQGKPNVLCEAALASAGAGTTLHLTFTINDPSPRKAFGKLEKGSLATLWFMDGSTFFLDNALTSEGTLNPENQSFVFQGQYPVTPDVLKKLRRMELDKIRIAWSSGYEDYDVQYVRLLMEQAKCLSE